MSKPRPVSSRSHRLVKVNNEQLYRFFLGYTQRSFGELGVRDRTVIAYVAEVLTTFAQTGRLYRLRSPTARSLSGMVDALAEQPPLQATVVDQDPSSGLWRDRSAHKHLGDYTLFMSGLFRAHVEKLNVLDAYLEEGRQSYRKVSELDVSLYQTGFLLFEELANNFEYYSGALDYMRKAHFVASPGDNPFGQFLRQVEGWVKTHLSQN